jgi:hypothetical protein
MTDRTQYIVLPSQGVSNARNMGEKRETIAAWTLVGVDSDGRPVELAAARWYMSRSGDGARPVYCSLWVNDRACDTSGHGRATGGGYCKRSAALGAAMESAGLTLGQDIDGRGESASRKAMEALGRSLGHPEARVVGFGF